MTVSLGELSYNYESSPKLSGFHPIATGMVLHIRLLSCFRLQKSHATASRSCGPGRLQSNGEL